MTIVRWSVEPLTGAELAYKHAVFDAVNKIMKTATPWMGTPYEHGSKGPDSVDCSGFITHVFRRAFEDARIDPNYMDIAKLRVTPLFRTVVTPQTGDIILWSHNRLEGYWKPKGHGGIVAIPDKNTFLHAGMSNGVSTSTWSISYWQKYFKGMIFRRYANIPASWIQFKAREWLKESQEHSR